MHMFKKVSCPYKCLWESMQGGKYRNINPMTGNSGDSLCVRRAHTMIFKWQKKFLFIKTLLLVFRCLPRYYAPLIICILNNNSCLAVLLTSLKPISIVGFKNTVWTWDLGLFLKYYIVVKQCRAHAPLIYRSPRGSVSSISVL